MSDVARFIGSVALVLMVVVIVHEFGHFLLARLSGIRVDEFAVGFGPRLAGWRRGETLYSLRALPFGGFVRMAGMMGIEGEPDAGERNFYRATIPRRMATIAAGGVFNLVFAAIVLGLLTMPSVPSAIGSVSPLYRVGMRDGDVFVSVGGRNVEGGGNQAADAIHAATRESQGRPLPVVWRDARGTTHTTTVAPLLVVDNEYVPDGGRTAVDAPLGLLIVDTVNGRPQRSTDGTPLLTGDPATILGGAAGARISGGALGDPSRTFSNAIVRQVVSADGGDLGRADAAWRLNINPGYPGRSLPAALASGVTIVPRQVADIFTGLYRVVNTPESGGFTGPNGLRGPVGVAEATNQAAEQGWQSLLFWIGFISINLGVINLLPIPFLDGGRFVFIALEAVRRRPLEPKRELAIHYAGLMLILTLVFFVTIADVRGHS